MGNLIQDRRRDRQLSAGEVARLLGVSEWTVRSWESGRVRPTKRHARALARVLKVGVDELGLESSRQEAAAAASDLRPLAAAIIVRDGRVLLTERRFPGFGEQWSWPSGKVESNESLEAAVLRELHEELLVTEARVLGRVGDIDLPSGYRMTHFHVAIPPGIEPKLNDYEQLVRTAWMTRDEAERAFGTLAPEIARQGLVLLDRVLSEEARQSDSDDEAKRLADARASRVAEREAWARQSPEATPGSPATPEQRGRRTGRS